MRIQFDLVNDTPTGVAEDTAAARGARSDHDLEMLGPPHTVPFQTASLKICGQQVEYMESYNKAYNVMVPLLPQSSRATAGVEGCALLDTASSACTPMPHLPKPCSCWR